MELLITDLRCDNLDNPIGIAVRIPQLSYRINSNEKNVVQEAVKLQIALDDSFKKIVYEEEQETWKQTLLPDQTLILKERTRYYWRISVGISASQLQQQELMEEAAKDNDVVWSKYSETAYFETGLKATSSFKASWIEAEEAFYQNADRLCRKFWKKNKELGIMGMYSSDPEAYPGMDQGLRRVPYFCKKISVKPGLVKARIYITAHGLYELNINGSRVGGFTLAPDFTAYDKMLYYQTYDALNYLQPGENNLCIPVGDGWYVGHAQGIPGANHLYGDRPALFLQMELYYGENEEPDEIILSDSSFEARTGALLYADLFMGEWLDLTQPEEVFATVERKYDTGILEPQQGEMIRQVMELNAVSVRKEEDYCIVDYEQVIAGIEQLVLTGAKNDKFVIEHAEELQEDGDIYNVIATNPFHDQTDTVILGAEGTYVYEPQFTFQGFRYLKVTCYRAFRSTQSDGEEIIWEKDRDFTLQSISCKAKVISTDMRSAGLFESDQPSLNRLMQNVVWSQRGNMISIPTDCPQRERAGFTGDAQVFAPAAVWNMDVKNFFLRWLEQCRLEQLRRGQIPIVVPYTKAYQGHEPNPGWTSAGWGDAIIFVPLAMYRAYDDIRFLEDNYRAMLKWMEYVEDCANETMPEQYYHGNFLARQRQKYLWNTGFHWGDWLAPGLGESSAKITKNITSSIYFFREVSDMVTICDILDKKEDKAYFAQLKENIKNAFHEEYLKGGKFELELQGYYVMAIAFGMVEGEEKRLFAERLNEIVKANGHRLQTGFLSTPFLLDALYDNGYQESAYKVLFQEESPSWLYAVKNGATTIWEEWECIDTERKRKGSSFNHYAFGCVCDFVYRRILGVQMLENGFHKLLIQPDLACGLSKVSGSVATSYGTVIVKWEINEPGRVTLHVEIPVNTSAEVVLVYQEKSLHQKLGSGSYDFSLT
jgi:alpha-L-rhamnosidase